MCLALAAAFLGLISRSSSPPLVRNRDSEVINAALVQFYVSTGWLAKEWSEGDFLAVDPTIEKRGEIRRTVSWMISICSRELWQRAKFRKLSDLDSKIRSQESDDGTPRDMLAAMDLDPRIVLKKVDYFLGSPLDSEIINRQLRRGSVRASLQLQAPAYSEDGKFATLSLTAPWSIHLAYVAFLLERKGTG